MFFHHFQKSKTLSTNRDAVRQRKKVEQRNQKGSCLRCGKAPPADGKKNCLDCLKRDAVFTKKKRDSRNTQKLCVNCGNPYDGKGMCDNCYREKSGHPRLSTLQTHIDFFFGKPQNARLNKIECILKAEQIVVELEGKILDTIKGKKISKFTIGVSTTDDERKKAGRLYQYKDEYAHSLYVTSTETDAVALAEAVGYFKFQDMFKNVSKQDAKRLTHLPNRSKIGVLYFQFNVIEDA